MFFQQIKASYIRSVPDFTSLLHCSKEFKEHPNAETQIFHLADPSVFVLRQPSAYTLNRQNDTIVFLFVLKADVPC